MDYINESLEVMLTTNPFESSITLYHASPHKSDRILPNSFNAGTKISKPRYSSFWADNYDGARIFGFFRLIEKMGYTISFGPKLECYYVKEWEYEKILHELKGECFYIYKKTIDKKFVGIGHSISSPEYTIDLQVKPDEIYVEKYSQFKDLIDRIKAFDAKNEDEVIKIQKELIKTLKEERSSLIRTLVGNDSNRNKKIKKEYKEKLLNGEKIKQ